MKELNLKKTQKLLTRIMEFELAGVVRYTHYSLMVAGPNRIPIVAFMKGQATESLLHAQQAGEILTGIGGHPSLQIANIDETYSHTMRDILQESLAHEKRALDLYKELLETVEDRSVYIEEFARTQIAQEELHGLELRKMLRDIGIDPFKPHDHTHEADADERDDDDEREGTEAAEKKSKKKKAKKKSKKADRNTESAQTIDE